MIIDRAFKLPSCHIGIANVVITDIDHIRRGDKITRILCNNRGRESGVGNEFNFKFHAKYSCDDLAKANPRS